MVGDMSQRMDQRAPRIRIDANTTWRDQVWAAFHFQHVGFTREPRHALRRLVEAAVHEERWAEAFILAVVLDREEGELAEARERDERERGAERRREYNRWYERALAEDEARVEAARQRRRAIEEERDRAELRDISESTRETTQRAAEEPLPDAPDIPNCPREGVRGGGGSAHTGPTMADLMLRRWIGEEAD